MIDVDIWERLCKAEWREKMMFLVFKKITQLKLLQKVNKSIFIGSTKIIVSLHICAVTNNTHRKHYVPVKSSTD